MSALKNRRSMGVLVAAVTLTAPMLLAGPASATTAPHVQTVTCSFAGFYENYNSATDQPVNEIDVKHGGETVGHTEGVHEVHGNYAAAFHWGMQRWGWIRNDCITHSTSN